VVELEFQGKFKRIC